MQRESRIECKETDLFQIKQSKQDSKITACTIYCNSLYNHNIHQVGDNYLLSINNIKAVAQNQCFVTVLIRSVEQ